jgi:hypothetical protein
MAKGSEDLRKFRHDIATLKRKGLIADVDARSAKPNRRLNAALDRYDAVLSGKASAVKLSKSGLKKYEELGKPFEVTRPKGLPQRVIIPHEPGERVYVSHGKVSIANPAGIRQTIIPVKYKSLPQYFKDLRKKNPPLKQGEFYAFRFFGNRSHRVFRSISALVSDLEHYEAIFDSIQEHNAEDMAELYQNLEILKIDRPSDWRTPPTTKRPYRRKGGKTDYEYRKERLERGPIWKRNEQRHANAERQKQWRLRLSATEKQIYNKAGTKRKKKSVRKNKKKKK